MCGTRGGLFTADLYERQGGLPGREKRRVGKGCEGCGAMRIYEMRGACATPGGAGHRTRCGLLFCCRFLYMMKLFA